jgi:hypothetical protein
MTGFIFTPPLVAGMDELPSKRLFASIQMLLLRANAHKF